MRVAPSRLGDAHRVLEEEPTQPGADHRGLQPQVLQLGPITVAGDSMPAHGDAIQVEHPDFLRGHVLGFQLQHRLHHREELRRVRPMGLGPMRQRPQRRRLLRFGAPDGRLHAPRSDGRSMAGQRSMTTSRPAAAARSAASSSHTSSCSQTALAPMAIASSTWAPARCEARKMSTTSIGLSGGRCAAAVPRSGYGGDAVDGRLARVDGDHLVAVGHQRARHPVAGPHRVWRAADHGPDVRRLEDLARHLGIAPADVRVGHRERASSWRAALMRASRASSVPATAPAARRASWLV